MSAGAGGLTEGAGGGSIRFAVRLQPASERMVTVLYATAAVTATAGSDYTAVSGTLTFHAGTTVRTVTVPIADDALDEAEEQFAVSLQAATNATVTAAEGTGTITDNDESPALSIDDASLAGGAANATMPFAVRLQPASERMVTVLYATADVTATAGPDYTAASGTLTFHAGTTTATVAVTILADTDPEETETFTVTLTAPSGATLADVSATGTISGDADTTTPINVTPADSANRLGLSSLAVTGAGAMFPAFDAGTLHYALTCSESATLSLSAATGRDGATVTLLRADSADNVVSDTGSLDASVTVDSGNDMAIEVSDRGESVTYVVHCLPSDFPEVRVLTRTDGVSDGVLLANLLVSGTRSYLAVLDNNGVPRFHRLLTYTRIGDSLDTVNFRRHRDGRYSATRNFGSRLSVYLYNSRMEFIESTGVVAPLDSTDSHDFLIAPNGNFLFISYRTSERNLCEIDAFCGPGETTRMGTVTDGVIQEVDGDGREVFRWNSWDHVDVKDCIGTANAPGNYAHLNSLHLVDGDIVASLRNCSQVVRIDRSSGTGAVHWQVGGNEPPERFDHAYLEIVGDTDGSNEFCKQHTASITASGSLLVFDNGVGCRSSRKSQPTLSRVVQYDISSNSQAVFKRQYLRPNGHGRSIHWGGVNELVNGHWLITWGYILGNSVGPKETILVSEVDLSGAVVLELNMSATTAEGFRLSPSYRAYRERETDVDIPPNLP